MTRIDTLDILDILDIPLTYLNTTYYTVLDRIEHFLNHVTSSSTVQFNNTKRFGEG